MVGIIGGFGLFFLFLNDFRVELGKPLHNSAYSARLLHFQIVIVVVGYAFMLTVLKYSLQITS